LKDTPSHSVFSSGRAPYRSVRNTRNGPDQPIVRLARPVRKQGVSPVRSARRTIVRSPGGGNGDVSDAACCLPQVARSHVERGGAFSGMPRNRTDERRRSAGWAGIRQFERRFAQCTGVTPKLFARVARFQTALDMKIAQPDKIWLRIAHDLCYYDQTHMVLDFKHLTGTSPTQILSQIGDGRPQPLLELQSAGDSALIMFPQSGAAANTNTAMPS
jgi:AraC-like DNA-binding protein